MAVCVWALGASVGLSGSESAPVHHGGLSMGSRGGFEGDSRLWDFHTPFPSLVIELAYE